LTEDFRKFVHSDIPLFGTLPVSGVPR
jgi:hypothetical protein